MALDNDHLVYLLPHVELEYDCV